MITRDLSNLDLPPELLDEIRAWFNATEERCSMELVPKLLAAIEFYQEDAKKLAQTTFYRRDAEGSA